MKTVSIQLYSSRNFLPRAEDFGMEQTITTCQNNVNNPPHDAKFQTM